MSPLPNAPGLPVHHLAAAFNEVTNSYKFLWLLAILDEVEAGTDGLVPISHLLGRMIGTAWYPVNYFRLNFGKQDLLSRLVVDLLEQQNIPLDTRSARVSEIATDEINRSSQLGRLLQALGGYVPFRFVRPFFSKSLRSVPDSQVNRRIRELAEIDYSSMETPCLYRFRTETQSSIEIHPLWVQYLRHHLAILRGYTLWHFLGYLQPKNPGVPSIATKLFEPKARSLSLARKFWGIVFAQRQSLRCIYSGQLMYGDEYSLDHFLPWRFVAHDNLWNIIPTPRSVNSAKGDRLPDFATYFDGLAQMQFNALQSVIANGNHNRLLEDYLFLLDADSIATMAAISLDQFQKALNATVAPQLQIAINLGFQGNWTFDRVHLSVSRESQ